MTVLKIPELSACMPIGRGDTIMPRQEPSKNRLGGFGNRWRGIILESAMLPLPRAAVVALLSISRSLLSIGINVWRNSLGAQQHRRVLATVDMAQPHGGLRDLRP